MENTNLLVERLISAYRDTMPSAQLPDWAVHKRSQPSEIIRPTIPFVGEYYLQQSPKIFVYASAENLSTYHKGNEGYWEGDWIDNDEKAENRHRYCFDDENRQKERVIPYVHMGPMEEGGLLAAVMFLSEKIRGEFIGTPRDFLETIAFANYGKFSIETELQRTIRNNPGLSKSEICELKKTCKKKNIDTAGKQYYLEKSLPLVKKDIEILRPDYIISPHISDGGFLESIKGTAKIIYIHQINGTVINRLAPNKSNRGQSKYHRYNPNQLTKSVREVYDEMRGVSHENYLYFLGYLDEINPNSNVH